jgi:hypothetical protein
MLKPNDVKTLSACIQRYLAAMNVALSSCEVDVRQGEEVLLNLGDTSGGTVFSAGEPTSLLSVVLIARTPKVDLQIVADAIYGRAMLLAEGNPLEDPPLGM